MPFPSRLCPLLVLGLLAATGEAAVPAHALDLGGLFSGPDELSGGAFVESWHGELVALEVLERTRPTVGADAELGIPGLGAIAPLLIGGIREDREAGNRSFHAGLGVGWDAGDLGLTLKSAYLWNHDDLVTRRNVEGWIGRLEVARGSIEAMFEGEQHWGSLSSTDRVGARFDLDLARGAGGKLGYVNARLDYEWSDPDEGRTLVGAFRAVAWGLAAEATLRNTLAHGAESLDATAAWDWWIGTSPPFRPPTLAEYFDRLARTTPAQPIFLLTSEEIAERPYDPRMLRRLTLGAHYSKNFLLDDEMLSFFVVLHVPRGGAPFLEMSAEVAEQVRAESFFEGVRRSYAGGAGLALSWPIDALAFARYRTRGADATISAGAEDVFLVGLSMPVAR